jgi:hypothetical protein
MRLVRSIPTSVLAFSVVLGACTESIEPDAPESALTPDSESSPVTVEGPATGDGAFRAVYQFEGRFNPATQALEFQDLAIEGFEANGLRTTAQAAWCARNAVPFSVNQNPVSAFRLSSTPILTNQACFGGTYPGSGIVQAQYAAAGALCSDVTVRNYYGANQTRVYAQIDQLTPTSGYTPFPASEVGATTAFTPADAELIGAELVPNASRGLWSYGDLGPIGSTNPDFPAERTVKWIFANANEPDGFRFRGRIVANLQEDCATTGDDNCNGRSNEGCGQYPLTAACQSPFDCESANCTAGVCQTTLCTNNTEDGTETDIDCGGACLANCDLGEGCSVAADCTSNLCQAGECVAALRPTSVGQIVITEFLANPISVADDKGEWIELHNATANALDLRGCVLTDDNGAGEQYTIPSSVLIPPNQYVAIGASSNPAENGGLNGILLGYGTAYQLGNSGDEIELRCNGTLIDQITYTTLNAGYATQVSSTAISASQNDIPANVCRATTQLPGYGEFGTPGAVNTSCALSNVSCRTTVPASNFNVVVNGAVSAEVAVLVPGLTDQSTAGNSSPNLQVQSAIIPAGSDPALHATWTTSSLLGGYSAVSSNAGSDKYGAALVMPNSVGSSFNVVFRARGDAAGAWTYCDRDGSANGYLAAQAPTLTASAVAPGPVSGDFLITEILIDGIPQGTGNFERNEFVELLNVSGKTLELNGCSFVDSPGSTVSLSTSTLVAPGQYVVVSNHTERQFSATPGAVDINSGTTGFAFANGSAGTISMTCGAPTIVSLSYSGPTSGRSRQIGASELGEPQPAFSGMCNITDLAAGNILSTGTTAPNHDYGTPGRVNPECAALAAPSLCYLRNTNPTTAFSGAASVHQVRFAIPGLTEGTGNNADARVQLQIGYGPADTDPSVDPGAFTWTAATATSPYTTTAEDQYEASLTINALGAYAIVGRLSTDTGATFPIYCDGVSETPAVFSTASMRALTVQSLPTVTSCSVSSSLPDSAQLPFSTAALTVDVVAPGFTDANAGADNNPGLVVEYAVNTSGVAATLASDFSGWTALPAAGASSTTGDRFSTTYTYPQNTARSLQAAYRVTLPGNVVVYCNPPSSFGAFNAGTLDSGAIGAFVVDGLSGLTAHLGINPASIDASQTTTARFRLRVDGLTNRLTTGLVSAEQSTSLVRVQHQLINRTTSQLVGGPVGTTFDSSVGVTEQYHEYTVPLGPIAAGQYTSRFEVSVDGVTYTAFSAQANFDVAAVVVPPVVSPVNVRVCFDASSLAISYNETSATASFSVLGGATTSYPGGNALSGVTGCTGTAELSTGTGWNIAEPSTPTRAYVLTVDMTPGTYEFVYACRRSNTGPPSSNVLIAGTGSFSTASKLFSTARACPATSAQNTHTSGPFTVTSAGTFTFSIYGWGGTGGTGTFRVDNIRLQPVP